MSTLFIGIDVSKGYCDVAVLNEAGSWLGGFGTFDDTRSGHDLLLESLKKLRTRDDHPSLVIGIEATGGLERNWVKSLRTLDETVIKRLNPMAVKRFLDQDLHRSVTDRHSARGIARYLAQNHLRREDVVAGEGETANQAWYRTIQGMIRQVGKLKNQLHSLIQSGFPELVQFCRSGFPEWVLSLLVKYPTAKDLSQAKVKSLIRIPYLSESRALSLLESAKRSVASVDEEGMRRAISLSAAQILHLEEIIRKEKAALQREFEDDPGVRILQTIPGIGVWGAVVLRVEIGQIDRFSSPKALVAYAGLDPRVFQSGDGCKQRGISRRGNRRVRSLVYLLTQVAVRKNQVLGAFYHRLRTRGKKAKVALIACARKMLHVIYACWISGKAFDETYEDRHAKKESSSPAQALQPTATNLPLQGKDLTAPVSRKEAKKRKAACSPQKGAQGPKLGGLSAAFIGENTTCNTQSATSNNLGGTASLKTS